MRRRELSSIAQRGRPTTFITLTVNPERFSSPAERAQKLVSSWRLIRQTLRRRFGFKRVPFIAIFEETENGEPHLHILARISYVAQRWLSRYMQRLMDAPIVDIRKVRSQKGVARYVSKYTSKAPKIWAGCKRYWRSMDWLFGEPARLEKQGPPPKAVIRWERTAEAINLIYLTLGYATAFIKPGWLIKLGRPTLRVDRPPPTYSARGH